MALPENPCHLIGLQLRPQRHPQHSFIDSLCAAASACVSGRGQGPAGCCPYLLLSCCSAWEGKLMVLPGENATLQTAVRSGQHHALSAFLVSLSIHRHHP